MEVPFYRHNIDESDIANLVATVRGPYLTTGHMTKKFEEKFAEFLGVRNVIGTTAEDWGRRCLILPLYPSLGDKQVGYVIKTIRNTIE